MTKDFSNALNPDYQLLVQRQFWLIIVPSRIKKIPADSKGLFYNPKGSKKIENVSKELKRFLKFPKDSKISEKSRNSSKTQKVLFGKQLLQRIKKTPLLSSFFQLR